MTVKKSTLLIVAAVALAAVVFPVAAYANFGVHGGYTMNTEACAGCHRAHTAPSSITWRNDAGVDRSALLISNATTIEAFCLVCHDNAAQGADTNVVGGIYEGTAYGTGGDPLLGGAFGETVGGVKYDGYGRRVTSFHIVSGDTWGAYGGGLLTTGAPAASYNATAATGTYPGANVGESSAQIRMDCATCHDVHGSSNYRLLKDVVYNVRVGGYDPLSDPTSPTPTPWVISSESGFPVGGFRLHDTAIMASYVPNYTDPQYAKAPGNDPTKGMSGWCSACHQAYMSTASTYNAGDGFGTLLRHRHPVNVPLTNFLMASRPLVVSNEPSVPLAHDPGEHVASSSDWIDCMTCHRAHGTSAVMTGWANVADVVNDYRPNTGVGGVPPANASALLRLDNRSACERCHNK